MADESVLRDAGRQPSPSLLLQDFIFTASEPSRLEVPPHSVLRDAIIEETRLADRSITSLATATTTISSSFTLLLPTVTPRKPSNRVGRTLAICLKMQRKASEEAHPGAGQQDGWAEPW